MTQLDVGDRVRHREEDKIGEVYGVHPQTIWVLWKGGGTPCNTSPSNLILVPYMEGDRVRLTRAPIGKPPSVGDVGTVEAVFGTYLWVKTEHSARPETVYQGDVEIYRRAK